MQKLAQLQNLSFRYSAFGKEIIFQRTWPSNSYSQVGNSCFANKHLNQKQVGFILADYYEPKTGTG
jgi:hypothetical protein